MVELLSYCTPHAPRNPFNCFRKRHQVESIVFSVEQEMKAKNVVASGLKVIEFGAGSGHVVLLLAYRCCNNSHIAHLYIALASSLLQRSR